MAGAAQALAAALKIWLIDDVNHESGCLWVSAALQERYVSSFAGISS